MNPQSERDHHVADPTASAGLSHDEGRSEDRKDSADVEAQAQGGGVERKRLELQDQTNLLPTRQVLVVIAGLSMALFCSSLNQTIIVTALPTLGQVFGRSDIASWVGTAYLLTSTAMQPLYGRLSDIFGRKPTLLASCIVFFFGSLACSVSANMIQLICFRAIQGIGGGGILTLSMIIASDIVTLQERGKYQSIGGVVLATSQSIGPLIGGLLTEKATWRWAFWISLCLISVAIAVIIFLLPLKPVTGDTKAKLKAIDWLGSILTLLWAGLFLVGLSWAGTQYAWSSPAVLVPIIVGFALLGLFLFVENHVHLPVIPLYIFKSPTVSASMVSTFFTGAAFFSVLYYLPTYLQIVHGVSPLRSGVLTLPLATTQVVTAFGAGFVASKTGDYWWNLVVGFAIWTIGLGFMITLSVDLPEANFIGYQIIVAIGAGQTFQTSLLAIQAAVERKDMAAATGTRNFMRLLGGTVGLSACGAIVNNVVRGRLGDAGIREETIQMVLKDPTMGGGWSGEADAALVREAYAKGISSIFYLLIPLTGISCILVLFFVKNLSLKRDDDAARKEEGRLYHESMKRKREGRGMPMEPGAEKAGIQEQAKVSSPVLSKDGETQGAVGQSNEEPSGAT